MRFMKKDYVLYQGGRKYDMGYVESIVTVIVTVT